jgi:hypothetical protein
VEFVAAITWLAEVFPDKRQREWVLGSTQAFASLGGLLVTGVNAWIVTHAQSLPALPIPDIFNAHASWRYTLATGLLPAIPIALLLPFVPESKVWRERRDAGTLKRPSFLELFSPALRRSTLVTALLSACAYGAAFGALQLTPLRVAPGVPELAEQRKELKQLQGEAQKLNKDLLEVMPAYSRALSETPGLQKVASQRAQVRVAQRAARKAGADPAQAQEKRAALESRFAALEAELGTLTADRPDARKAIVDREKILKAIGDNREKQEPFDMAVKARGNKIQFFQEMGGLLGRIALAVLVVTAITRGSLLRLFLIPGLVAFPLTYFYLYRSGAAGLDWAVLICGMLVVAQFSYFGEYLPKLFPLHLRGTGGSFATNVGGRMLGTSAAFLTGNVLAPLMPGANTFDQVAMAAGIVATTVFLIGLVASFFLPEPSAQPESQ